MVSCLEASGMINCKGWSSQEELGISHTLLVILLSFGTPNTVETRQALLFPSSAPGEPGPNPSSLSHSASPESCGYTLTLNTAEPCPDNWCTLWGELWGGEPTMSGGEPCRVICGGLTAECGGIMELTRGCAPVARPSALGGA